MTEDLKCNRCGNTLVEWLQRGEDRLCIHCIYADLEVERARTAQLVAQVENLRKRTHAHSVNEGRLHTRIAQEQTTIALIERTCERHGYVPDGGEPVSDWITEKLTRLEQLQVTDELVEPEDPT